MASAEVVDETHTVATDGDTTVSSVTADVVPAANVAAAAAGTAAAAEEERRKRNGRIVAGLHRLCTLDGLLRNPQLLRDMHAPNNASVNALGLPSGACSAARALKELLSAQLVAADTAEAEVVAAVAAASKGKVRVAEVTTADGGAVLQYSAPLDKAATTLEAWCSVLVERLGELVAEADVEAHLSEHGTIRHVRIVNPVPPTLDDDTDDTGDAGHEAPTAAATGASPDSVAPLLKAMGVRAPALRFAVVTFECEDSATACAEAYSRSNWRTGVRVTPAKRRRKKQKKQKNQPKKNNGGGAGGSQTEPGGPRDVAGISVAGGTAAGAGGGAGAGAGGGSNGNGSQNAAPPTPRPAHLRFKLTRRKPATTAAAGAVGAAAGTAPETADGSGDGVGGVGVGVEWLQARGPERGSRGFGAGRGRAIVQS